jgi:hypothetical protein
VAALREYLPFSGITYYPPERQYFHLEQILLHNGYLLLLQADKNKAGCRNTPLCLQNN